jgi:hypothetical protein
MTFRTAQETRRISILIFIQLMLRTEVIAGGSAIRTNYRTGWV